MSQGNPKPKELEDLESAINSETKTVNIRLREGEYQHSLAKTIATFELELSFPDVKDLVRKLFGEKLTEDAQFVSKIQTVLKKMEKSGIVKILPKEKPWELQRYALTSFKFQDVEKNLITFATKSDLDKTRGLIHSQKPMPISEKQPRNMIARIPLLVVVIALSLAATLWSLVQPTINLLLFVSTFTIAAASSTLLGIFITRKGSQS